MSWAREKAFELCVLFRMNRTALTTEDVIERGIRETIEEAAQRCDEGRWVSGAGADHGAQHCRTRILDMLGEP